MSIGHQESQSVQVKPVTEHNLDADKASLNAKSVMQEESKPPKEKVVEPLPSSVDEKVKESKISSPISAQMPSSEVKYSIESASIQVKGVVSQASEVATESLKRKLFSGQEVPEKKPRVADGSVLTTTEGSPPKTASLTAQQRVPPLKVRLYFYLFIHIYFLLHLNVTSFRC